MLGAVLKSIPACLEFAYTINVAVLYFTVTKQFSFARSFFEDWQSIWISVVLETLIACPIKNVCSCNGTWSLMIVTDRLVFSRTRHCIGLTCKREFNRMNASAPVTEPEVLRLSQIG